MYQKEATSNYMSSLSNSEIIPLASKTKPYHTPL